MYAKTDEGVTLNNEYQMSGNRIGIRTLDLNQEFVEIRRQLDEIAESHFGAAKKEIG